MRGLSLLFVAVSARCLVAQTGTPPNETDRWIHRSWTIEDGLPQNTVTAITQTQDGYLWIGTLKGLARFDGARFTGYEAATTAGRAVIESDNERFATRLIELVDARLGDTSFNVEELADEIGLSRRQLTRRVKATMGEAPSDLIHRMRLERAVELLEAGSGTVSEVAYRVGFKSASHFGAAFKEAYRHTPGEHPRARHSPTFKRSVPK